MKQISLKLEVEVRDDFESGWCDECPLSYEVLDYDEDDGCDNYIRCVFDSDPEHCPLEAQR